MKKILLDTNAYAAFLSGDEQVLNALAEADTVYMSVIVLGELYAGFRGGNRPRENKGLLAQFLQKPTVHILNATAETADVFGQIKHTLKDAGTPIPINDVWIASQAMETGAVVVTYDTHFHHVPGLRIWDGDIDMMRR